jgi:uncharacterized protein YbbC (DUF1343 family)
MTRPHFKSFQEDAITRRNGETEKPKLHVNNGYNQDFVSQDAFPQNCFLRFFSVALLLCVSIFLFITLFTSYCSAAVLPGIDTLSKQNFDILQGKRVGLITNHTGRSSTGDSTIDLLHRAPGVQLFALFSPEHGIRGDSDAKVSSGIDTRTGLPIHSLYGTTCRPTPEMLQGIDVLVFDIQDIGTRFYTYIGTLSLAMRASKEAGIPFVVLDRPNPIGGEKVQGAIPTVALPERASSCGAITSIHPIPTRHGMTMGELARLFNEEHGIGCSLTVIPLQGWQRSEYYDRTGLAWINPSPNMKSLAAAVLYPGPGILETTNLSVGRGTADPFQIYGAPWVKSSALLKNLKGRSIPGVSFSAVEFIPTAMGHPYRGKSCYGIRVEITDRESVDPIQTGLHLVQAFFQVHPRQFKRYEGFATEVGDREAWSLLTKMGMSPEFVAGRWAEDLQRFRKVREKYLMY